MRTAELATDCSFCGTPGRLLTAPAPEGFEAYCTVCLVSYVVGLRDADDVIRLR